MKFDVLRDGSGAMKGERLNWNCERWERQKTAFWRNGSAVRQYVPGYRFGNWRQEADMQIATDRPPEARPAAAALYTEAGPPGAPTGGHPLLGSDMAER